MQIDHSIKVAAADFAVAIDQEYVRRDCTPAYADIRESTMALGAFRAFEYLEQNGYKVVKE